MTAIFGLSNHAINQLISAAGYPLVGLFVAIESSGIPFPGETTLVLAAVYAGTSGSHLQIGWVIAAAAIGAIGGDNIGYAVGRFGGRKLINRFGHYVRLQPTHLAWAENYFRRHGDKTVFLGRFVAVLRAWAALLAGINHMPWTRFLFFNAAGGIAWAVGYGILGYALGSNLPVLFATLRYLGLGGIILAVAFLATVGFVAWKRRSRAMKEEMGRESPPGPPSSSSSED